MSAPRYPDLAGKAALVTGGADGIGRAIVAALHAQGARVATLDRDGEKLTRLRDEISGIESRTVDLTDLPRTHRAVGELEARLGGFSILVNNAGHDERHDFATLTPESWRARLAVNLDHVMFVTQQVAPGMIAAGVGSIVNLGSTSWMKGAPGMVAYTTAKAAILGFTKTMARELGARGVRVNAVAPGWVMTARQSAAATPERLAMALDDQALKLRIAPEDIAAAVIFLCSDAARAITGQTLVVDAGAKGS